MRHGNRALRPDRQLCYLNFATLVRLARKRYDGTREGGIQRLADAYVALCAPGEPVDEEWVRKTATESWDREQHHHDRQATYRQLAAFRTSRGIRAKLRQLRVPTLVIHGEDDPWIKPRAAEALANTIPGSRLITYPGIGHEFPPRLWNTIARDIHQGTRDPKAAEVPCDRSHADALEHGDELRAIPALASGEHQGDQVTALLAGQMHARVSRLPVVGLRFVAARGVQASQEPGRVVGR